MRHVAVVAAAATLAFLASPALGLAVSFAPPGQPRATLAAMGSAYEHRSLPEVESLLSADFRFHFSGGDSAGQNYAHGFTREQELRATSALFHGVPGDTMRERPDSILATTGTIDEGVDPEHPDSTCQYRLLVAHDYQLRLVFVRDTSEFHVGGGLQVFHVVRGDAAVRTPGQPADTTRWYIRRWLEDLDALTLSLASIDGECASAESSPGDEPPPVHGDGLGMRIVNAPLCPTLKVLCDLPGNEPARMEVYDVLGRRVAERTISVFGPGTVLVEAGNGRRFTPGVYWMRLYQGRRPVARRMVVVAR